MWEFAACVDGWNRANGVEDTEPMTAAEFEQAVAASHWVTVH
jgi:hypothetical protein